MFPTARDTLFDFEMKRKEELKIIIYFNKKKKIKK